PLRCARRQSPAESELKMRSSSSDGTPARETDGAKHLRVAIDGTILNALPHQDASKFEVIAGRVERDGHMGRRFVCALPRRTLTKVLIAAALEQSGWTPPTRVDVVTDGARGMRSLVTSVAPRVAPKI